MRNELLQERASRQDLECDKMALERQVHTLLSGGKQVHTVLLYKLRTRHQLISFTFLFIVFIRFSSILTLISHSDFFILQKHSFSRTSLFVTSLDQRTEEHSG